MRESHAKCVRLGRSVIRLLFLIRKHKDSFNRTKILVNGTFAVE